MQAVILNGSHAPHDQADAAAALLEARLDARGADVRHFVLRDFDVGHCLGEFDCWVRHPGRCRIKDEGQEIERAVHGADICAFVTPVTFGGYAPQLKKALDRLIPLILPFFAKRAGFTQHLGRYGKLPSIIGVGVDSGYGAAENALFLAHVEAAALNLGVSGWNGVVLEPQRADWPATLDSVLEASKRPDDPSSGPAAALAELKDRLRAEFVDRLVAPTRVAVLQASARAPGTSTSQAIADHLAARLTTLGVAVEIVPATRFARDRHTAVAAAATLASAEALVVASPLYVSTLPYLAMRALTETAQARGKEPSPQLLFGVVNCGFPEPEHTRHAFGVLRHYAHQTGAVFAGGLSVGGGEMIHGQPLARAPLAGKLRAALDSVADSLAAGTPVDAETCLSLVRPPLPPYLYRFAGAMGWNQMGRQRGLDASALRAPVFDNLTDEAWRREAAAGVPRARPLRVVAKHWETADAASILFEDPAHDPVVHLAGQYLTLELRIDGEPVRRSYSIASTPGDPGLAITVKRVSGGRVSNHLLDVVQVGDLVRTHGPAGRFTAGDSPLQGGRRLLLVAGGTGIVPLAAISRHVLETEPDSEVTIIYGAASRSRAIYAEALEGLAADHPDRLRLVWVLEQDDGTATLVGRPDEATMGRLLDALDPLRFDLAMLCGPDGMRASARACLLARGIDPSRIVEESFVSPRAALGSGREEIAALLRDDGSRQTITVPPNRSLLEAALDAGAAISFSCMSGGCGACRVTMLEGLGATVLDEPNDVSPGDREAGRLPACITRLTGPVLFRIG